MFEIGLQSWKKIFPQFSLAKKFLTIQDRGIAPFSHCDGRTKAFTMDPNGYTRGPISLNNFPVDSLKLHLKSLFLKGWNISSHESDEFFSDQNFARQFRPLGKTPSDKPESNIFSKISIDLKYKQIFRAVQILPWWDRPWLATFRSFVVTEWRISLWRV